MHRRATHFDGVYRDLAGQLRLRPTSLERRGGTLVHQHLGAELHHAAGEVGEGRFEADQWSDGERAGVQHHRSAAAPPVLGCGLGVANDRAEQRAQGHVFAEGHQS